MAATTQLCSVKIIYQSYFRIGISLLVIGFMIAKKLETNQIKLYPYTCTKQIMKNVSADCNLFV